MEQVQQDFIEKYKDTSVSNADIVTLLNEEIFPPNLRPYSGDYWDECLDEKFDSDFINFLKSEIETVECEGGGEGEGEECHYVWYFKSRNIYVRIDGSYYSYDGTHWEYGSYRLVNRVERMTAYYE